MIKSNFVVKTLSIIALLLFLFVPSKIVQCICLGFDLTVLFSYFYALILLKNLDAEKNIQNLKVSSKEQIEIKFSVLNRCRLPALVCFVQDTISMYVFGDENNQLISLRPYEKTFVKYKVMAKERGLFTAGPVVIKSSDPIGFFEITKEVTYKFYYDDLYSLVSRMEMYKNSGVKNIGFWRLGQEETAVWEYIKTK